jgi:hypothetical protein
MWDKFAKVYILVGKASESSILVLTILDLQNGMPLSVMLF